MNRVSPASSIRKARIMDKRQTSRSDCMLNLQWPAWRIFYLRFISLHTLISIITLRHLYSQTGLHDFEPGICLRLS